MHLRKTSNIKDLSKQKNERNKLEYIKTGNSIPGIDKKFLSVKKKKNLHRNKKHYA